MIPFNPARTWLGRRASDRDPRHGSRRPAVNPPDAGLKLSTTRLDFTDFDDLSNAWIPLTLAINSLNRSMGLNDPYPFVLSKTAVEKVRFVHDLIERSAAVTR